ncbi:A-kinase anchor protein 14 [Dunckerocampus dactyliophorus]|uniref:A-kinase anchor protein 14 n=1 Tax=Dunckerocampus dactyliophorus TaxID=161453 RepID=UPI0024049AFB|nr:A-kinase anchor protein 14 [Dunckerocampus dactyliophorus]
METDQTNEITDLTSENTEHNHPPPLWNLPAESWEVIKILRGRELEPPDDHIKWVAAQDFTVEVGKEQLAEYIRSWELEPRWIYSLDFLCSTEEERRLFYHYRARFSTPSPEKPIQGTASVYFAMDVFKDASPSEPVEVHFVVESNRFVHTPGRIRFTDKWLVDIIENKLALREAFQL